ncbi:TIGR03084 family metal-binding protein [Streptomyces sp. SAJ15]|uniref:TIGR03084 family metal-binding protein n=1 Tax=Streptomyces sp. SAJ15 TaxID=2011095 RepID=UPI0011859022|nr:TIGR03084 family metal-binding protein [Streptomyces sp. SAJ15]TVL89031.1 TIGR03084 family protein [Streptomyces sp. SAJ15]
MSQAHVVLGDLRDESEELDALVVAAGEEAWTTATPAPGWTVGHQIAHLVWTDERAVQSVTDPDGFARDAAEGLAMADVFVDRAAREIARASPAELLRRWRASRSRVQEALARVAPGVRLPWYGPPLSAAGMATGRMMETWAHGEDIADALGVRRAPTGRLRHVARIGVRARDHAFATHGLTPPAEEFRVELAAPDGELWAYGPEDARQRVTGPALDFCLLAVQRAHRADLALRAEGPDAERWLDIAQAFAGPSGEGRAPSGAAPGTPA